MQDDEVPRHRSRKNTRRWCKGVPGREHTPVCKRAKHSWAVRMNWFQYTCTKCGKVLAEWYNIKWLQPKPKPEWVDINAE